MDTIPAKIYDTISYYMIQANKFKDKKGREKKVFVLNKLKENFAPEVYAIHFELISEFIDFLIKMAKNKKLMKMLKTKSQGTFSFCLE